MKTELSPLEALERIKKDLTRYNDIDEVRYVDCGKELDIIETELKEQWLYKQDYERVMNEKNSLLEEYKKNQKKLKALEIIKEKMVDVGWLKRAKDLHEYNSGMGVNSYSALTQEEFDLLKEVLK